MMNTFCFNSLGSKINRQKGIAKLKIVYNLWPVLKYKLSKFIGRYYVIYTKNNKSILYENRIKYY